jgi:hypothetical protein
MKLDRKEFIRTALALAGAGFGVSRVAGCDGSPEPGGTQGPPPMAGSGGGTSCENRDPSETISTNHGHVLSVSQADVAAGMAKTYNIQGTSVHDHTVTISAASFATLRTSGSLQLTSSTASAHSHGITIVCT